MSILNLLFQLGTMWVVLVPDAPLSGLSQQASNRISVAFFAINGIALGLLALRKWAVLYFCLASVSAAVWLFFQGIWFVPFPCGLCYLVTAVVFVLPTIILIRSWSLLSWGGRWFI